MRIALAGRRSPLVSRRSRAARNPERDSSVVRRGRTRGPSWPWKLAIGILLVGIVSPILAPAFRLVQVGSLGSV